MKQITNKEYEEWQKYKAEKAKGKSCMAVMHNGPGRHAQSQAECVHNSAGTHAQRPAVSMHFPGGVRTYDVCIKYKQGKACS